MRPSQKRTDKEFPLRRNVLVVAARVMLMMTGASLLITILVSARWLIHGPPALLVGPGAQTSSSQRATPAVPAGSLPSTPPTPEELMPDASEASDSMRVGIVAGHAGYDPGAVCPDGLTEAEVNLAIAQLVEEQLTRRGYQVDLLDEFDERLAGYQADVLVSIHADSCEVPGATGFKVARITNSFIPESEDRLVDCLYREYEAITGLPRHPDSITDSMTNYHAFREIAAYTPGAIIETGFLLEDRQLLARRPRRVAQGIAAGIVCFLEPEEGR